VQRFWEPNTKEVPLPGRMRFGCPSKPDDLKIECDQMRAFFA
jgi:hypothetical protein